MQIPDVGLGIFNLCDRLCSRRGRLADLSGVQNRCTAGANRGEPAADRASGLQFERPIEDPTQKGSLRFRDQSQTSNPCRTNGVSCPRCSRASPMRDQAMDFTLAKRELGTRKKRASHKPTGLDDRGIDPITLSKRCSPSSRFLTEPQVREPKVRPPPARGPTWSQ